MKFLDRFTPRQQLIALAFVTLLYLGIAGPFLISADNTPLVILGFAAALFLLYLWFGYIERHFDFLKLPKDEEPGEYPPSNGNTHPASTPEELLQEARDVLREDVQEAPYTAEEQAEIDATNRHLSGYPEDRITITPVDPSTADGPNAPGTTQHTDHGTRQW